MSEKYLKELEALLKKGADEQAALDRDNSFHFAKTGKRDVVVHLAVTILPRVNGRQVIGDREREMGQWCFEIQAKHFPTKVAVLKKCFSELMTVGYQCLMKMGAVRE